MHYELVNDIWSQVLRRQNSCTEKSKEHRRRIIDKGHNSIIKMTHDAKLF